ncbi:uncharacterized protein LOC132039854 isoform X2 [Lycium ferocissimum]|uniref:uncharacterized protein LOC132039854 isoform X2 n=1 Tax=Lycium ferocissimum TaxID=112874 RepID=UPI0028168215|nr:uncharacterized protein LOC132039854 isoform X2 [Lycium ferocissimum]
MGGIKETEDHEYTVSKVLHTYNSNSTWEIVSAPRNLRWHKPLVFAFGRRIYVVGGNRISPDYFEDDDEDWTHFCEFYDLDNEAWHVLSLKVGDMDKFGSFGASYAALMDNKTTTVFYSFYDGGSMLFYDVVMEELRYEEHHPNLELGRNGVRQGLEGCKYLDVLFRVAMNRKPLVCYSTLYWFSCDLCLYGYDFGKGRWYQSRSLLKELIWPRSLQIVTIPLLFDLCNGKFLVMAPTGLKELGMAILVVRKEEDSLVVSVQSSKIVPVDTLNHINPMDGMVYGRNYRGAWGVQLNPLRRKNYTVYIRFKNEGSMLGKRNLQWRTNELCFRLTLLNLTRTSFVLQLRASGTI